MLPTPDTRSQVPRRCSEGPPSGITDAAHSKMCMNGTNHLVPSYAPAHTGPCAHPRPRHSGLLGCGKWVWGPATKWPAYAVRQKALAAQIQAFGSLFCAAQSRPRPGLRLRITWPVYGEVFRSLRPSLSQRHTRNGMHANRVHRHEAKMLHAYLRSMRMHVSWSTYYKTLNSSSLDACYVQNMNMRARAHKGSDSG